MTKILLIGSANTEDVIVLGEFPTEGGKQGYKGIFRFEDDNKPDNFIGIGGSAVNWSLWLKAAGGYPLLVCPIGNDDRGKTMSDLLDEAGIKNHESSRVLHTGATAHTCILVSQDKELRTVLASPRDHGVSRQWSQSLQGRVEKLLGSNSDIRFAMIGNIYADSEKNCITPQLINTIHNMNKNIIIYANFGSSQYTLPHEKWGDSLGKVDCFQFALCEAKKFVMAAQGSSSDMPSLGKSLQFFYENNMNVIVTLGRGGAISLFGGIQDDCVRFTFPRQVKTGINDPSGAGDAFGAGFVAYVSSLPGRASFLRQSPLKDEDDLLIALGTGSFFGATACHGFGGCGSWNSPNAYIRDVGKHEYRSSSLSVRWDESSNWLYALDRDC